MAKVHNERGIGVLRGAKGRMLASEYETFKKALDFDISAFFKNPSTQMAQMKGAYNAVWSFEQGLRRQLAEARAQGRHKDVNDLMEAISEAKAWRDGLISSVPNEQHLKRNINIYVNRMLPVFNEANGRWVDPEDAYATMRAISHPPQPPMTPDELRRSVPVPVPSTNLRR